MANFAQWFESYGGVFVSLIGLLFSVVYFIFFFIRYRKKFKNAKTDEEKQAILEEIKGNAMGFITVAEGLFSDIPKSGVSKLVYVLKEIKALCEGKGVEFNEEYWTAIINNLVGQSNAVIKEKALEMDKADIIEKVKAEIPYHMNEANQLFERIPDSQEYKVAYILKAIEIACDKYEINVFLEYDWRAYVYELYNNEKGVA